MRCLFPRKLFFDRHEFLGNISNGKETIDNLHIIIQYPLITSGKLEGEIWGTEETSKRISDINRSSGFISLQLFYEFEPEADKLPNIQIKSQKVHVTSTSKPSPERPNLPQLLEFSQLIKSNITYKIADIEFADIDITIKYPRLEDLTERSLEFFFAGNPKMWLNMKSRLNSPFTGEVKHEFYESKIDLDEGFSLNIEIIPRFFFEQISESTKNEWMTSQVPTLRIATTQSEQELPNERFAELGIDIVNDIELLVSLIYKRWTTWYLYELQTKDIKKTHIRDVRKCSIEELSIIDSLVPKEKINDFLKVGFKKLRKFRREKFNLLMPISYFIAGHEATYLEEKFAITFLSLEKLEDIFRIQKRYQGNLSDENFKKLKELTNLSEIIKSNLSEILKEKANTEFEKVFKNIEAKISELNRPPLRFILDQLFAEYKIDWIDLYPPEQRGLTILKTRNDLFHSSTNVDPDYLLKEFYRLQALIGRLFLRMLDWENISYSPSVFIKNNLIK